jgi:hypothetical protein
MRSKFLLTIYRFKNKILKISKPYFKSIFSGDEAMMKSLYKVKMFKSIQQDIPQMEDVINQWLEENSGIQIIDLAQSETGSRRGRDTVVTFLYSETPGS